MSPMLARTYGPKFSHYPCYVQPKLNGVRALYSNGVFQSRDEKLWQPGILQHLITQLQSIPSLDGLILDGELYHHGWRLQRINGAIAVNRKEPVADTLEVEYHVFDCIDPQKPVDLFSVRNFPLAYYAPLTGKLKWVKTMKVGDSVQADYAFKSFVADGYEGLMLRPDGPYEPGKRSKYLYKRKQWEDGEFVCTNYTRGEGKASNGIGALTLSGMHGTRIFDFNCGTGYTDEERQQLLEKPPINRLVRVRYPYLSEDGIPQCPSFVAVM